MAKIRGPTINKMLKNIAKEEGIEYDKEALKLLSKKANGDIRSAINTFQAIADTSHELTMEDVERDLEIFQKLHGQTKQNLLDRKAMMSAYKIKREDLDN